MNKTNKDAFYEPASLEDISTLAGNFGKKIPASFVNFWEVSNGALINDYIKLYSTREISERNKTFEVDEFLPDFVLIGHDSGGKGFFLECDQSSDSQVYVMDLGSLQFEDAEAIALSFENWQKNDFRFE